ncbi:AAA family ATPase [Embleya scabrispora]|uniref:AAA family ATPase n=1 Tax=Embleya scabrispora TaxID=159449 RepID=UPI0003A521E8|nr:AAA family ATPase [Embleya scabrispora]
MFVPETMRVQEDAIAVRDALATARVGLVDREVVAEVVTLCAVAGEHLLVIGAPGTAKSLAVRRIAEQLGGRYFEYMLGRFTEPNEIFGPVDLRRLREGVVEIRTAGMLPEAEIAFLDEVFLGSTAILNTLLGLLNERIFRRGATVSAAPLRVCVGAANHVPQDPSLAAFADRFLARVFVEPVADARLEELLEEGDTFSTPGLVSPVSPHALSGIDRLSEAAQSCRLASVRPVLATAVRRMRAAGVPITDRRAVRSQRLVAAAAVLDGRLAAEPGDLWTLPLIASTPDAQAAARDVLADLIGAAGSGSLCHAAEEYSHGSAARARRLAENGRDLLARFGSGPTDGDRRLRLEAVLREIDAGFAATDLGAELAAVRDRLVAAVQS